MRNQPVSRIPSLSFLRDRLHLLRSQTSNIPTKMPADLAAMPEKCHSIDPRKVFYVLNPSKDLVSTQKNFETLFQGQTGWKGIVGREPTLQEMETGINSSDL